MTITQELQTGNPELWAPDYTRYDYHAMVDKLDILGSLLQSSGIDIEEDMYHSRVFLNRVFSEFESGETQYDSGSFAFLVPPRIQRSVNGEHDPYAAEWTNLYPILRHVDSHLAQLFLVGTPPFIVDQYGVDATGRRGYMLCAPLFADMRRDMKTRPYYEASGVILKDAFTLARRLGVSTIGLGATLPKLLFLSDRHGRSLDENGIDLTTGHAGTVWLIGETLQLLERKGYKGREGSIGILGTGSIGMSTLAYLRLGLGYTGDIHVYDVNPTQVTLTTSLDKGVIPANDIRSLIDASDTIICAATTPVRLDDNGFGGPKDLTGKVIIDDSQPGCFDPEDVKIHGGQLVWVIGHDGTDRGEITRETFDYAGSGPIAKDEIWGCELEAWGVYRHAREFAGHESLAVRRPVTVENVQRLATLLVRSAIAPASLQAQGRYLKH